jgi:hypothetical protein
MKKPISRQTHWLIILMALIVVTQAAWFCGCASLNYYPSHEDDLQRAAMNKLINADPVVQQIMLGHRGWNKQEANKVNLSSGQNAWSFAYGLYNGLESTKTFIGADERRARGLDNYGRGRDKPFTEAELDTLAEHIASASKTLSFTHKLEFRDLYADRVTRVVGAKGSWVRKK